MENEIYYELSQIDAQNDENKWHKVVFNTAVYMQMKYNMEKIQCTMQS